MGDSDWAAGSISLLRGWSSTGTGSLERKLIPQASLCLRGIWTVFLTACLVSPEVWVLFLIFCFPPSLEQSNSLWPPRAVGSGNAAAVGDRSSGTRTVLRVGQCARWEAQQQQQHGDCVTPSELPGLWLSGLQSRSLLRHPRCIPGTAIRTGLISTSDGVDGLRNTLVGVEQLLRQQQWGEFSDRNCCTSAIRVSGLGWCQNHLGWSPPPLESLCSLWEAPLGAVKTYLLSSWGLGCWETQRALEGTLLPEECQLLGVPRRGWLCWMSSALSQFCRSQQGPKHKDAAGTLLSDTHHVQGATKEL